jgi:hypothetical protein
VTINNTSARVIVASLATAALLTACGTNSGTEDSNALALADQGSFAVGGTTTTAAGQFDPFHPAQPQGQTYRGDRAYAFYQVPQNARKLPLVLLHGAGQFSRTWETTPDGRDSRICSCAGTSPPTWSTSHDAATPAAAWWAPR